MEYAYQLAEWDDVEIVAVLTLKGAPASPGVIEGSATVIKDPEELSRVKAGTILVCPNMSREMTVVFPEIKGVVSDHGGVFADAATIARENKIPAVVGTRTATESIHNGDIIRVDGTVGLVEVLSSSQ